MQAVANLLNDHVLPDVKGTTVTAEAKPAQDGSTYRALAWFGNKDVRMVDAPVPTLTQDNDVILEITGTTICGSDLHLYHGEIVALKAGDILGHEFMGKVKEFGKNVTNLKVGQRVVCSFQVACGECSFCKKKLSSFCEKTNDSSLMQSMYGARDAGFFGYSHFTGGFPGGQAELVRVPYGNVNLLPIPDSVSDEQAVYLSDVLPTSYNCVVNTGVEEGDVVGVWGAGPIGLFAAKWSFIKGAKRVIIIDKVQSRLDFAKQHMPEIETLNFTEHKDVPARLLELVPNGIDVGLDCGTFHEPKTMLHKAMKLAMLETDVPETINEMIKSVKKTGRCGLTSVYAGYANMVNVGALMEKQVRLQGNGQAPVHLYWEEILQYIIDGKIDPTFILTHRVPIEDFPALYDAFDRRLPGLEKVFVETKYSAKASPNCPQTMRVKDIPGF